MPPPVPQLRPELSFLSLSFLTVAISKCDRVQSSSIPSSGPFDIIRFLYFLYPQRDLSDGLVPRNGHSSIKIDAAESKKVSQLSIGLPPLIQSRMDHIDTTPSSVIHIRNVPGDVNEHEIALLAIPFGIIKNMVLSKKSNQALIEMYMIEDAIQLIEYYSKCPVVLHSKNIILQFSTHSHLELTSENSAVENAVKNANRIVQQDLSGALSGNPNCVLRIVISNTMGQQINHLILYKVSFSHCILSTCRFFIGLEKFFGC